MFHEWNLNLSYCKGLFKIKFCFILPATQISKFCEENDLDKADFFYFNVLQSNQKTTIEGV